MMRKALIKEMLEAHYKHTRSTYEILNQFEM